MKATQFLIAVIGFILPCAALAQQPSFVDIRVYSNGVSLLLVNPTPKFIVEATSSLSDWSSAVCVGSSAPDQYAIGTPPPTSASQFYRVRTGLEVVTFPDERLRRSVREAILSKVAPTNEIYDVDLWSITNLVAQDCGIADLTGLEHMTNLVSLDLDDNFIANGSSLAGLTNLRWLNIPDNRLTDLNFLYDLRELTYLNVGVNNLSDIASLANLTKLTHLSIGGNPIGISYSRELPTLPALEHLDVAGTYFTDQDLIGLASMTNLATVILDWTYIRQLDGLVQNARHGGLGAGAEVSVGYCRLNRFAVTNQIPELESYGVTVHGP